MNDDMNMKGNRDDWTGKLSRSTPNNGIWMDDDNNLEALNIVEN